MREKGFITPEFYQQLKDAPLELAPVVEVQDSLAPEVVRVARRELRQLRNQNEQGGAFNVETTIRPPLQRAARQAVRDALSAYADRHQLWPPFTASKVKAWGKPFAGRPVPQGIYVGVVESTDDAAGLVAVRVGDVLAQLRLADEPRYNPKQLPPSGFTRPGALLRVRLLEPAAGDRPPPLRLELGPQAALAAIDVRTRQVVALVGSQEGTVGGFDRSTQAHRQPGSAFKPFVYSAALHERKVSPATVLELEHPGHGLEGQEPPYRLNVRAALAHSNNEAAVQLLRLTGPATVVAWAQQLGIRSPLGADDSLALGSYELTPLELANAYASFASGGVVEEPSMISAIVEPSGGALPLPARPPAQQVMSREEAYLLTSLLEGVVDTGTAAQAQSLGWPVAAKTGTTNQVKDAWFAGYSTELSVAVWVGFDDALPLGREESGTRTAGPIFVQFMRAAHEGRPAAEFPRPAGILTVAVDAATGLLPWFGQTNTVREDFLDGMAPEVMAPPPGEARTDVPAPLPVR
jgi:penicillin-binding protein 1A